MFDPIMLTSSIITSANFESLVLDVFILSWLSGWKPVYLLVPSRGAECNVMPLMFNVATPVGAVSNTMTSFGSKVPDCLRSLIVSELISYMTYDLPTPPGPLRKTLYGSIGLPCFSTRTAFLHHLR